MNSLKDRVCSSNCLAWVEAASVVLHFLAATFKTKKKQVKLILIIIFYLTQYNKNIILTYNQHKIINEMFPFCFALGL